MNATGKLRRKDTGMNRYEIHKAEHSRKRPGKQFNNNKLQRAKAA